MQRGTRYFTLNALVSRLHVFYQGIGKYPTKPPSSSSPRSYAYTHGGASALRDVATVCIESTLIAIFGW